MLLLLLLALTIADAGKTFESMKKSGVPSTFPGLL
jgi:hypothetical protein